MFQKKKKIEKKFVSFHWLHKQDQKQMSDLIEIDR